MSYIVLAGKPEKGSNHQVIEISVSLAEAKSAAETYVSNNPGAVAHVFYWETGFESKPSVSVERVWEDPIAIKEDFPVPGEG